MVEAGSKRFPWRELMATGLGRLRLAPADFWAMTPRELAAAAGAFTAPGAQPPGRTDLDALMKQYPDGRRTHGAD